MCPAMYTLSLFMQRETAPQTQLSLPLHLELQWTHRPACCMLHVGCPKLELNIFKPTRCQAIYPTRLSLNHGRRTAITSTLRHPRCTQAKTGRSRHHILHSTHLHCQPQIHQVILPLIVQAGVPNGEPRALSALPPQDSSRPQCLSSRSRQATLSSDSVCRLGRTGMVMSPGVQVDGCRLVLQTLPGVSSYWDA